MAREVGEPSPLRVDHVLVRVAADPALVVEECVPTSRTGDAVLPERRPPLRVESARAMTTSCARGGGEIDGGGGRACSRCRDL